MKREGLPRMRAQTPFERLTDFTRHIVAVPKTEVDKKRRAEQRRKTRQNDKRPQT